MPEEELLEAVLVVLLVMVLLAEEDVTVPLVFEEVLVPVPDDEEAVDVPVPVPVLVPLVEDDVRLEEAELVAVPLPVTVLVPLLLVKERVDDELLVVLECWPLVLVLELDADVDIILLSSYTPNIHAAPQVLVLLPAHASLQVVSFAFTLVTANAVPQKHSMPYSTPAKTYAELRERQ